MTTTQYPEAHTHDTLWPEDRRQVAILDAWAYQAAWTEALQAWAEHAYTLRELAAALHRAGLARCRLAATLNRWATHAAGLEP